MTVRYSLLFFLAMLWYTIRPGVIFPFIPKEAE